MLKKVKNVELNLVSIVKNVELNLVSNFFAAFRIQLVPLHCGCVSAGACDGAWDVAPVSDVAYAAAVAGARWGEPGAGKGGATVRRKPSKTEIWMCSCSVTLIDLIDDVRLVGKRLGEVEGVVYMLARRRLRRLRVWGWM